MANYTDETAIESNKDYELTSEDWANLLNYQFYFWEGLIMAVANVIIVAAILIHKELRGRKVYIVVGQLALLDAINGMGFLCAGFYRSYLIVTNQHKVKVTPFDCLTTLHNTFFILAESPSAVALTTVTLDRMIAVTFPLRYFNFGAAYALKLCAPFWIYYFGYYVLSIVVSLSEPSVANYDQICFTSSSFGENSTWKMWYMVSKSSGAFLSCLLYIVVVWRTRQMSRSVQGGNERRNQERLKEQRRLNVTIGISTLCTFVLFVIPNNINTVLFTLMENPDPDLERVLAPMLFWIANLNGCLNVFIYSARQKELRAGIVFMFKGKSLTKQHLKDMKSMGAASAVATTKVVTVNPAN